MYTLLTTYRGGLVVAGFALMILLAGCQTARMPLPQALSASERLPVQGRQGMKIREHMHFGPYEAIDIDRSWTRGSDLQVLAYKGNRRNQQYAFVLREGGVSRWRVACDVFLRVHAVRTPVVDVDVTNRSELECSLHAIDQPAEAWRLSLEEKGERPLEGVLLGEGLHFEVRGTRHLEKGLPAEATTGYQVTDAAQPVGAVEVIGSGAVWLHEAVQPAQRGVLAATATALLLLEDLRAHLPADAV